MSRPLTSLARVVAAMAVLTSTVQAGILVVAPHPDDDIISAAGVIAREIDRNEVTVVFVTNGDENGPQGGYKRQDESVAAEALLGVPESNLIFLGYPDTGLRTIYLNYTGSSDRYVAQSGQSETYGRRGLGSSDYHSYIFGAPGAYNLPNIRQDLASILRTYRPDHIFTPSEFDTHADHAASYLILLSALEQVHAEDPTYVPVVHKTIIWSSDPSIWPAPADPTSYNIVVPGLSATTLRWEDRESLDVPYPMQDRNRVLNLKNRSIQIHIPGNDTFVSRFLHKDEIFWSVNPLGLNQPPVAEAGRDRVVAAGDVVILDGSTSRDPDGSALTYRWLQRSGSPVALEGADGPYPSFQVPAFELAGSVWSFQLTVNDGLFDSASDMVNVFAGSQSGTCTAETNVARLAAASASSEASSNGQDSDKAIDGIIDGYPGDSSAEWATRGQGAGAWIQLNWSDIYSIDRVILYDRPNGNDQVLSGQLSFSDGSVVPVGPLPNGAAANTVDFPPRAVSWARFSVSSVSSSTSNVGLAEFEVCGARFVPPIENVAPVLSNPGSQSGTVGVGVSLQLVATDGNGDALSYGASGLPAGLTLDATTGLVTGTPSAAGTSSVTVTVSDGRGGTDSKTFSWTIAATDTVPPSIPTNLVVTMTTTTSISLAWGPSSDTGGSGLVGYRVYRNGSATPLATVTGTSYTNGGLSAGGTYTYTVKAIDNAGNESSASNPVTGAAKDIQAPTVPANLVVTGTTATSISLSWSASSDAGGSGLARYRIYRNGSATALTTVTGTSYTNSGLTSGTSYTYTVTAYDNAGNESAAAGPVSAPARDTQAPTSPTNLAVTGTTTTSISLGWGASTDSGGSGRAGYRIYRDGNTTPLATVTGRSYTNSGLVTGTTYTYKVTAFDNAGNESPASPQVSGIARDTQAPATPTNLAVTSTTTSSVSLTWGGSSDSGGSGRAGYRIYRDGSPVPLATIVGRTFTDSGLVSLTSYSYRVTAYDNAGNESAAAGPVTGTTR